MPRVVRLRICFRRDFFLMSGTTRHILVGFTTLLAPLAALPLLAAPSPADVEFLNTLDRATAQYFLDQADPQNFLMPVTWSEATGPARRASASGTGLELAALCIADNHGWIGARMPFTGSPRSCAWSRGYRPNIRKPKA